MTLLGKSWSWQRHAKEHLLHHCGHFRTLRRVFMIVAGGVDAGRIGGFERQQALMCQIRGILDSAPKDGGHDLTLGWALVCLSIPDARPDVQWSPADASAVIAWYREAAALEMAKKQLVAPTGTGTPKVKSENLLDRSQKQIRAAAKEVLQVEQQGRGRGGGGGKRRRGKLSAGRGLDHEYPARLRDRERRFPPSQSDWPMFFALIALFSRETGGNRHSSCPSQCKAASDHQHSFLHFLSCVSVRFSPLPELDTLGVTFVSDGSSLHFLVVLWFRCGFLLLIFWYTSGASGG